MLTDLTLPPGGTVILDFDDVFFPADYTLHRTVKKLAEISMIADLGENSILTQRDDHGHLPYFPQYVLYKFIQCGREPESPDFITAMKNCFFGMNHKNPEHYNCLQPNDNLRRQLDRLINHGVRPRILTSGPYNPHVEFALDKMGLSDLFPRDCIHDVTRFCALADDVELRDFVDPAQEKILRWFKPQRENYLAMLLQAGISSGGNLYFEDNDTNGSKGVTPAPEFSEDTYAAFERHFEVTRAQLDSLNANADRWVWINLKDNKLRADNHPPALDSFLLEAALAQISLPSSTLTPRQRLQPAPLRAA